MNSKQTKLTTLTYPRSIALSYKELPYHHPSRPFRKRRRREAEHVITKPLQETLVGAIELNYVIQSIDQWNVPPTTETTSQEKPAVPASHFPFLGQVELEDGETVE
jgi:hypothetical protein